MNTSDKIPFGVGTILNPVPAVIVTCGTLEKPNALTIAWTGTLCSNPPKTYISVRPERYSYEIIKSSGEFCINLTTAELAKATDYLRALGQKRRQACTARSERFGGAVGIGTHTRRKPT